MAIGISIASKVREYVSSWRKILLLARRPDNEEYMLLLRLNILGFLLVGSIGYLIHLTYILIAG